MAAEYPSWWTSNNVISSVSATNDYWAANQGQVKWIASNACNELNACLPNGAGTAVSNVLAGFSASNNFYAVNQGQLKSVAKPFWDRLITEGYTNALPWSTNTSDDVSYALANLGQVKNLFSFDLRKDNDSDGLANWRETGTGVYVGPYNTGSSATNPDSDGDGLWDGAEVANRTNPNNNDTTKPVVSITSPINNFYRYWVP